MKAQMQILVKTILDDEEHKLELTLIAGEIGLNRLIKHRRVQKPGIALAGYPEAVRPNRVLVFGKTEIGYLETLTPAEKESSLGGVLSVNIACVFVTTNLTIPQELLSAAENNKVALFPTPLASSTFINRINSFLDKHLSPEISLHGVLMDVFGVGVILTGSSGIGKSECGLDLVLRGHRLVADDMIIISQQSHQLVAYGSPLTKHHMEVRGLGIINVKDLFGAASICNMKQISLMVDLVEWDPNADYDRTGLADEYIQLLDTELPKITLPIRPGRSVASIVEVAARNYILKSQGHNSAKKFQSRVENQLRDI